MNPPNIHNIPLIIKSPQENEPLGFLRICVIKIASVQAFHISKASSRFELGLEKQDPKRALQSALTIALAYVLGGMVPLLPYTFIHRAQEAVVASVIVTIWVVNFIRDSEYKIYGVLSLLIFGYAKGYYTDNGPFRSALQTAFIGVIASAAAFGLAKVVHP